MTPEQESQTKDRRVAALQDPNDEPASLLLERIRAEGSAKETSAKSAAGEEEEESCCTFDSEASIFDNLRQMFGGSGMR